MNAFTVSIVVIASLCARLEAKTLYVDVNGDDTVSYAANGPSSPWRTIGRALWGGVNRSAPNTAEAARAGDTVIVQAGTYLAGGTRSDDVTWFNPANSGAPGAPIVIRAQGAVTIRPEIAHSANARSAASDRIQLSVSASTSLDAYAGWYIRIVSGSGAGQSRLIAQPQALGTGLIKTNSYNWDGTQTALLQVPWTTVPDATSVYQLTAPGPLIGANNRDYITWDGFRVLEDDSYTADVGPVLVKYANNITLLNLEIVGTMLHVHFDNHNGIRLNNANDIVVRNCVIRGYRVQTNWGNNPQNSAALMTYFTNNVLFENNLIEDTAAGIFPKGGTNFNHVYRYNVIRNCSKAFRVSFSTQIHVYQNVISDCGTGFQPAEGNVDVRFSNNVFYNGPSGVSHFITAGEFALHNNIFLSVQEPWAFDASLRTSVSSNRNLYSGYTRFRVGSFRGSLSEWQAGFTFDGDSTGQDPMFVNAAGGDFHLQPGSPALSGATDLYDLDGDGDAGETIPRGAYITGSETIGPSARLAPDPPGVNAAPSRPRGMRLQ